MTAFLGRLGVRRRYALYFAPAPTSAWWRFGVEWLGRDAGGGAAPPIALGTPSQAFLSEFHETFIQAN